MARHWQKKNIRNNSGNSLIVGIDQIMMSPIELLKYCYQFFFFFFFFFFFDTPGLTTLR